MAMVQIVMVVEMKRIMMIAMKTVHYSDEHEENVVSVYVLISVIGT